MANRYTNIPAAGGGPPFSGCLIKIPIGSYFLRLGCMGDCGAGWSVNYDPVTNQRDDPTLAGYAEQFEPLSYQCNGVVVSAGGDSQVWNRGGTIYSRTIQRNQTGDTAKDPIDAIDLRDWAIPGGGQASLIVRLRGYVIAGLAGGYTLRAEISPDSINVLTIPAGTDAAWEVELHICYDGLAPNARYSARGFIDGLPVQIKAQDGSFDRTVEQTLTLSVQAADDGDQIFCNSCVVVQENTDFCPMVG